MKSYEIKISDGDGQLVQYAKYGSEDDQRLFDSAVIALVELIPGIKIKPELLPDRPPKEYRAQIIPAKVCEVEDRDGDRWKPCGTDTWRMDSADGTATYIQTGDLIAQYSPLIHIMKVSANGCVNIDPREVDGGAPE